MLPITRGLIPLALLLPAGLPATVVGAISAMNPYVRIDTRVLRVESGRIVKTAVAQGREEQFFKLQKQLSDCQPRKSRVPGTFLMTR